MSTFLALKNKIAAQFAAMCSSGSRLYTVAYDRDIIWQTYISAFETAAQKAENTCNCCKSFIRQIGAVVIINPDYTRTTLWDIADIDAEYVPAVAAIRAYVLSAPIEGLFYHSEKNVGTDYTVSQKTKIKWYHYHLNLPSAVVGDLAAASGEFKASRDLLKRAISEITEDSAVSVLELIEQNSLYRGNEYKHMIQSLIELQKKYKRISAEKKEDALWLMTGNVNVTVARIKNTSIGKLLSDISEGMDLDAAVSSYERITAPANYRRPTALVTPRMVEAAKKRLEELGLISALSRRRLDSRDLKAANALYVYRPTAASTDVFSQLTGDAPVDPAKFSKVEEMSITDFIEKILPSVKEFKCLFERSHVGNLATLTGPVDHDANNLFKWDNSFGWSYTGGVADSIKERVKMAGGRVDNVWLRASLAWHNYDDLDLHLTSDKKEHVYFGDRRCASLSAHLDVDMNAGSGTTREPVENIYVENQLPAGTYTLYVNNWCRREAGCDEGFELEISVNGANHLLSCSKNPAQTANSAKVTITVDKAGNAIVDGAKFSSASAGINKWGLTTGKWQTVTALTLSPNHWAKPVGNKHYFFILKGAVSDEITRPFYNEFLCDALAKERKVTEALASKIQVRDSEGAELSGLGFSDTIRNHLYVEVTTTFKRTIKINF